MPETIVVPAGEAPPDVARIIAARLKAGGIVAMRTDTVYGLLASVNRPDALARLVELKSRPPSKPFVVLGADWLAVRQVTPHLSPVARRLGTRHWPGPVTLVLPAIPELPAEVLGVGPSIAVRVPDDALLLAVLRDLRCTVAAPSANRAGASPAQSAEEVLRIFGDSVDLIIDGGIPSFAVPSTLVSCVGHHAELLRPGPVELDEFEREL